MHTWQDGTVRIDIIMLSVKCTFDIANNNSVMRSQRSDGGAENARTETRDLKTWHHRGR